MSYLIQVKSFLSVYRAGSITKAASRLGLSQPAVTAHIQSLESFLGITLFIRQAHGVTPTVDAEEIATEIGYHLDSIEEKLTLKRLDSKKISGLVTIIGPAELLWSKGAKILSSIKNNQLRFKLLTGNREKIYSTLNSGDSELALTTSKPDENKFCYQVIGKEKLIIIASAYLADNFKNNKITYQLLYDLPLIAYDEQLPLIREFLKQTFGVITDIKPALTVPDLRIIEQMLQKIRGWTVMPEYLCEEALENGLIIKIDTLTKMYESEIYLVWNESVLRHPRVMYVKNQILKYVQENNL